MRLLQMPTPVSMIALRASEDTAREGQEDFDASSLPTSDSLDRCGGRSGINEDHSPWAIYRNHTVVLLRKYFRMSLEIGRMPSLLGGELFRAKVTAYRVHTFEDSVIFVHDMEQCLARLDPLSKLLIGRVVFQEFTREETARELRVHERHLRRRLLEGIDRLTRILFRAELLEAFPEAEVRNEKKPPASEGGTVFDLRKID